MKRLEQLKWATLKSKTKIIVLVNIIIILIGFIFLGYGYYVNNSIFLSTGAGLFTSGIVALFYLIYPQIDIELDFLRFRRMGLKNVYSRRDISQEYSELLEKAEKQIDVLGFGLNQFREDNGDIIKSKALTGINVRFLVIDPESSIVGIRSYQESDLGGEIINIPLKKLKHFVNEVNKTIEELGRGEKIKIKCYNAVCPMIFRIDDTMFIGPYLHKRASRTTLTCKIEGGSEIFKQYEKHFEDLWVDTGCTRNLELS
ncbi:hypothetical protein C5S35_06600 [Candidatus Methanophagaceae archaeon]|nr:hypothetical protein C5S35_06600 [Methanophagales archaeon]